LVCFKHMFFFSRISVKIVIFIQNVFSRHRPVPTLRRTSVVIVVCRHRRVPSSCKNVSRLSSSSSVVIVYSLRYSIVIVLIKFVQIVPLFRNRIPVELTVYSCV
jgi:hypothetical protein